MPSIHATRMFVVLIYYYFFRLPCGRKKGTRTGEGEYAKRREVFLVSEPLPLPLAFHRAAIFTRASVFRPPHYL